MNEARQPSYETGQNEARKSAAKTMRHHCGGKQLDEGTKLVQGNRKRRSLGAPTKSDGTGNRMAHWLAGALGFQMRRLQLEIPARLAIGIIHQHHAILVLQTERLLFDHFTVLANETRAKHMNNERDDREPGKNVPCGDEIQAAEIVADRRDRGTARQPVPASANLLEALIGQYEVDRGGGRFAGDELQELVGRAIGGGCVRAHAKTVGNRLELFGFLADASPAAPPPRLMHERTVSRVHQSDDAVVHAARQIGPETRHLVAWAKRGKFGCGRSRSGGRLGGATFGIRHERPDVAVALLAGKATGMDAVAFEL